MAINLWLTYELTYDHPTFDVKISNRDNSIAFLEIFILQIYLISYGHLLNTFECHALATRLKYSFPVRGKINYPILLEKLTFSVFQFLDGLSFTPNCAWVASFSFYCTNIFVYSPFILNTKLNSCCILNSRRLAR